MRRNILHLLVIIFLASLHLLFPANCSKGVSLGIHISMYSLIPSILPFMILSNYIVYSNMSRYISKIIHPVFSKIFHTSENGSYVVFMGFLCGFPLGSKILFDLLKKRKISASEANSLFKYINNPSPSFIICYMSSFYFENFQSKLILLLMMYAPSLIIGIFNFHSADNSFQSSAVSQVFSFTKVLDESIFQALQTLVKLSGYIIVFCIFSTLFSTLANVPSVFKILVACCLEMTSGIFKLAHANLSFLTRLYLSCVFSILGGVCVIFQINSVIRNSELNIFTFIKYKILAVEIFTIIFILYYSGALLRML